MWWQDNCNDKVHSSAISGKYKRICREKEIFCDRNGQLFHLAKGNENVAGVHDRIVGTARFRPGWPGQNGKEIDDTQINFNELF